MIGERKPKTTSGWGSRISKKELAGRSVRGRDIRLQKSLPRHAGAWGTTSATTSPWNPHSKKSASMPWPASRKLIRRLGYMNVPPAWFIVRENPHGNRNIHPRTYILRRQEI